MLAECCGYGALRDDLVRDRLVVGITDEHLSVKLQFDATLTLKKAVDQACQKEAIRKQQTFVLSSPQEGATDVDAIQARPKSSIAGKSKTVFYKQDQSVIDQLRIMLKTCRRCGKEPHSKHCCPARDVKCHKCAKTGHFASVCLFSKQIGTAMVLIMH